MQWRFYGSILRFLHRLTIIIGIEDLPAEQKTLIRR